MIWLVGGRRAVLGYPESMDILTFLPHLAGLRISTAIVGPAAIAVTAHATARQARCPGCACASAKVHSRTWRQVADLPWAGRPVLLRVQVRRFFCLGAACPRRTFTERIAHLVPPGGRRSVPLTAALEAVGMASSAQAGARLANRLGMPVSPRTLLRILHRAPVGDGASPTVVGIDDWAWRRGQAYGTLIVDLERHQPVDLLPDRAAESVAAWLGEHPGIQIISRDRGDIYAEGVRRGAPQAVQVLDRWHLCRNLAQALERCLERQPGVLRAAADRRAVPAQPPTSPPDGSPETSPAPARPPTRAEHESAERRAYRLARYEEVCRLHADGVAMGAIARRLGISHKTVRRHLRAGHFRERAVRPPAPTVLDAYRAYLDARWSSGCRNGLQLYRELRDHGYTGSRGAIARYAAQRRREEPASPRSAARSRTQRPPTAPVRPRSVRQLVGLFLHRPDALTADEQANLAALCLVDSGMAAAYACAQGFMRLVRERRGAEVAAWLAQTLECGVPELVSFANGLQEEQTWVEAACTVAWSQGQTEGQVTRLKLIKRQCYGRAGFPLLRKRVLYAA